MITVIKSPTKQYQEKIPRKHFVCKHCGTEWLADPNDYKTVFEVRMAREHIN